MKGVRKRETEGGEKREMEEDDHKPRTPHRHLQEEESSPATESADSTLLVISDSQKSRASVSLLFLVTIAAAVIGSSPQFGYNSGVLNSPQKVIIDSFGQNVTGPLSVRFSDFEMSIAVAIFAIGGMLGALPAGKLADLLGRKLALLLNNVIAVVGVGLQSLAVHPAMFITGRFVIGICAGVSTVVIPIYLNEISPIALRGAVGVMPQMLITSSILLAEVLGVSQLLGRPDSEFYGWRILFAVPLIFSLFQLLVLPWCPSSPRFLLIKRKKPDAARRALVRLRGTYADIDGEIKDMECELEEQERETAVKLIQFISVPSLRRALLISIMLHLAQQLSGINGIFYYSTEIFRLAGVSNPDLATIAVGVVLVLVTIATVFLIEVLGRRTLMLYGLGGMVVFFLLLTSMFCFQDGFYGNTSNPGITAPGILLVLFSLGIVLLFGLGPGGIPWLMVSEMFLQEARTVAVAIATIVNWFTNFVVSLSFPYILKYLYPYGTLVFVGTCSVLWLYLFFFLPETKGRSVADITEEFQKKTKKSSAVDVLS